MGLALRQWVVGGCLALVACGQDGILRVDDPGPSPRMPNDAGTPPTHLTRIREDFDNLRLIESAEPAGVIDVNRGVATLPVYSFPSTEGDGISTFEESVVVSDLLEAQVIRVAPGANLDVPDSVELRASRTITVQGTIRAGAGGVILAAQEGIFLEPGSLIESRGPVRLLLGNDNGQMVIDGEILTRRHLVDSTPADIALVGRGELLVGGRILTFTEPGVAGGDLNLNFYGNVTVSGRGARIAATAPSGAKAGVVRIYSEQVLKISDGASIGTGYNYDSLDGSDGGPVELQARSIDLSNLGTVVAGRSLEVGGDLLLTAQDSLQIGEGTVAQGGAGAKGGSAVVRARELVLSGAGRLAGGAGDREGGGLSVEAASRVFIDGPGVLAAGDAACGDGGHASFVTGGLFHVTGGAAIRGGDAGVVNARCIRSGQGGDVILQAASFLGLETGVRGGAGQPAGQVVRNETTVALSIPDISLGTSGRILSKIIDRGEGALGTVPQLVDFGGEAALGTTFSVRLCGVADPTEPFLDWRDVADPQAEPLEAFRDARYFRYQVELHGRAFDAPILNYFEIDLAPLP